MTETLIVKLDLYMRKCISLAGNEPRKKKKDRR